MSRKSVNDPLNGFDYDKQAWVKDGQYQDCGHVQTGRFCCNAHQLAGTRAFSYIERTSREAIR